MSEVSEAIRSSEKDTVGFFKYISTFDDEQKSEILNMIQYSVLAIIPIMIILRCVKSLVPEEDESKGSLEIAAESILQIIFIMVSIWLTNRIIRYVPTYSKTEYGKFSPVNFIIPFLIILTTMQSKLGFKLNMLMERGLDAWHGKTKDSENDKSKQNENSQGNGQNVNYRVGHEGFASNGGGHQPSQSDYLDINQLTGGGKPGMNMPSSQSQQSQQSQQSPDFNAMYQGPANPLVNAGNPADNMSIEPMAANAVLGGGFGGSAW